MNLVTQAIDKLGASFFYYDLDAFESHVQSIKNSLHPEIKIWYACKANPLSKILSILNENGFGVDVASLGELHQAQNVGVKKLISTGPAKSREYLKKMMEAGVTTIVIESFNQLKDLDMVAQELKCKQDVLLRVQLEWADDLKSVLGGSSITPFGLGVEDWKQIDVHEFRNLNIRGLHCFQWGNIMKVDQLEFLWDATISQCVKLSVDLDIELEVLDLGGGLGISYHTDEEMQFTDAHKVLLQLKNKYKLNEVWLELGRFTVAKFGSYLTKIMDIKSVRGKELIVTEGGINHIARPALVNESFPCVAFNNNSPSLRPYSIHGPLCTALDFLGDHNLPQNLKVGDWLEFKKAGAYGFTESMPYFLCHAGAGEAVQYKNELTVLRPSSGPQHWMK